MSHREKIERIMEFKPYAIVVVIPILFTFIFGMMFSPIFVKDLPVGLIDMDQSPKSRMVVSYLQDSDTLKITEDAESTDDLRERIMKGELVGGIVIPQGFGEGLTSKTGTGAVCFMDHSNFMFGNNIMSTVSTIFETVKAGTQIKYLEAGSMVPYQAQQSVMTMNIVDRTLYNPQLAYFYYLYPGLLAIFIQQTYLAAVVPMLIEEKGRLRAIKGSLDKSLLRVDVSLMLRRFMILAGLGVLAMMACLQIAIVTAGLPMKANIFVLMAEQVVFCLAITGLALVIGAVFDEVAHATQFTMFLTIPTFLTCGYAWPEYLMAPGFLPVVKVLWPLYYFINPFKDAILKGEGLEVEMLAGCAIFAVVWMLLGARAYGRKVKIIREVDKNWMTNIPSGKKKEKGM